MRILYLSTLPQIPDDILEPEIGFARPIRNGCEIVGILCEAQFDRLVDKSGHGQLRLRSLDAKRLVEQRVEVDGGSLGCPTHRQQE